MINLHRTTDTPPLAVLQHGQDILIFPWADLLTLRELVAHVPAEAAWDEDAPRIVVQPWAASGSSFGIALMYAGQKTTHWETDEWQTLGGLLFVGDDLLSQIEAAEILGKPQPRISEAIASGTLFAFQVPDLERRQWRIPRRALEQ